MKGESLGFAIYSLLCGRKTILTVPWKVATCENASHSNRLQMGLPAEVLLIVDRKRRVDLGPVDGPESVQLADGIGPVPMLPLPNFVFLLVCHNVVIE